MSAAKSYAPHLLAQYGLELATAWNSYYNHKNEQGRPDTQVLKAEAGLKEARLALVRRVKETLAQSLGLAWNCCAGGDVVQGCKTCELTARRDRGEAPLWDNILRTPLWDVVHNYETSLPGWHRFGGAQTHCSAR